MVKGGLTDHGINPWRSASALWMFTRKHPLAWWATSAQYAFDSVSSKENYYVADAVSPWMLVTRMQYALELHHSAMVDMCTSSPLSSHSRVEFPRPESSMRYPLQLTMLELQQCLHRRTA